MSAPARPPGLVAWLHWLKLSACRCLYGWGPLGRLYGVSMGHGWVRLNTAPTCPHHGERDD